MMQYENIGKMGLFDKQETLEYLSNIGHPLEKVRRIIDFNLLIGINPTIIKRCFMQYN